MAESMAMIATTIMSSIKVTPRCRRDRVISDSWTFDMLITVVAFGPK